MTLSNTPGSHLLDRKPIVLQLLPSLRPQPDSGAPLRSKYLCQELSREMDIFRIGFGAAVATEESACIPHEQKYTIGKILRGVVGPVPLPLLNYDSKKMRAAIRSVMTDHRPDIVQLESVHMSVYLPLIRSISPHSLIVADWHYIDSEFMHRFASNCNNPAKKLYAFRTADLLRTAERNFANSCAMNIAVCERERGILASIAPHVPAYVVPNGIECSYYSPEELARAFNKNDQVKGTERKLERNRLLFVGSMDYQANIDAVVWFGDRVWPELSHRLPQLLFTVVGRDPSTAVIKLAAIPRIEVTGWVADVRGFYHDALAAVVPLHFGSGTRIKILEAMAANVPVVSTSAGAEGLDVLPDVHYLAAETPEDFRLAIENLHSDSPLRKRLTMNARRLVEKRYDWKLIGSRLRSIYCGALNLHAQSTA